MAFSINTNVASLQAQNYLQKSSMFQAQTINEVTSGLRIVNSGDDAAGLAVANGYRSDEAVLTQGIQNANNGLSTLQTIDGGMSNISTLLDRARTLATESASGTFTGDRSTLNSEFQSVIAEVSRQATSIGMNQGGTFNQALSVFIGGGKGVTTAAASVNGSIGIDLSKSSVDAQSLGLQGVQATGVAGTNLVASSATSVSNILTDTNNLNSQATQGTTTFSFRGAGFSDANAVNVSVNLSGVTDVRTLVTAVNTAIQTAGSGATSAATAFKNSNIVASVKTDASGNQSMAFTSSSTAFQVQAGDKTSNALLGNFNNLATLSGTDTGATVDTSTNNSLQIAFDGGSAQTFTLSTADSATGTSKTAIAADLNGQAAFSAAGKAYVDSANHLIIQSNKTGVSSQVALTTTGLATSLGLSTTAATISDAISGQNVVGTVTAPVAAAAAGTTGASAGNIIVRFQGSSLASPVDIKLSITGGTTSVAQVLQSLTSAVANNASLQAAGIKVGTAASGSAITFTNSKNEIFSVQSAGDNTNILGFGTWQLKNATTATSLDSTTITAGAVSTAGAATLEFSAGGGQKFAITATLAGGAPDAVTLNAAFALNAGATAAGLQASQLAGKLTIASSNGTSFRLNEADTSAFGGFGTGASNVASTASSYSTAIPETSTFNSGGAQNTQLLAFSAIQNGGDAQTISVSTTDTSGGQHTAAIVLENNATARNAGSIDAAVNTINTQLQKSNDPTLQGIVAVKESSGGQDNIRFLSTKAFQVTSGTTGSGAGVGSQGSNVASAQSTGGGSADISTVGGAAAAVTALSTAVQNLGSAQAAIGKGENNLNYAISLAQNQVTNEAASESQLRDANLAQQAANLTKAQILVQAGTAALAQANSAPQQLISLLK